MYRQLQSSAERGQNIKPDSPVISPGRVFKLLSFIILTLFSISSVIVFIKYYLHKSTNIINILLTFFSLDRENNIPTYFSSVALLAVASLLFYIFLLKRTLNDNFKNYWLFLSIIFLYISMDEFMSVHELLIEPLQNSLDLPRFLHFAWVIPGLLFVGIVGLLYIRFLLKLKARYRNRFLIAAMLYVGGALGIEMVGGYVAYADGTQNFLYGMITNLEEAFEMTGVAYFIFTLLLYMRNELKLNLVVKIKKNKESNSTQATAIAPKHHESLMAKSRLPAKEKSRSN